MWDSCKKGEKKRRFGDIFLWLLEPGKPQIQYYQILPYTSKHFINSSGLFVVIVEGFSLGIKIDLVVLLLYFPDPRAP